MRSIGLLAVVTGTLVLASACSDGGGVTPPDNTGPNADFGVPACTTGQACTFTSTSTDDHGITAYSWDFNGDGQEDANTASASFQYDVAADYNVSLTVHDEQGLSSTKTKTVTITQGNIPPTAAFTFTCTGADCSFTSTSTDAAPGTIATYAWNFGDGATSDVSNPTHTYAVTVPTDFTVTLTVTDNEGATNVATQTVSVTPVVAPIASFTYNCNATACSFTSTSSDAAPGSITTYAWTFGDGGASAVANPIHNYAVTAPEGKDFTVSLTVTDNDGLTGAATQTIHVAPAAATAEGCVTSGSRVDCALNMTSRSYVKLKLLGLSCELSGQRVVSPQYGDQMFLNVCFRAVGDSTRIFGGAHDTSIIFEAGSQAVIRFVQGTAGSHDPVPGAPAAHLEGTFPNWTIRFEDGANPGAAGEPDFADVVLGVEAVQVN